MEDFINYAIYPAIGIGLYQLSKMFINKIYCKLKTWNAMRCKNAIGAKTMDYWQNGTCMSEV